MNRRTKWVLGVTVALITAASLRFTVGHPYWGHHRHQGQHHHQCESRWHQKGESGQEKLQAEPQTNQ
ncbi:hypothetical protein [Runella sp.]|jgi:hypothetical protein|uniref:hypothetical protein n=1 Tax=Runella sp. TaxID=1960881 RepID=UPI00261B7AC1|nr:hypothetical protein [Runella sp.]